MQLKTWQKWTLGIVGLLAAFIYWSTPASRWFRYQMTVHIEVNGQPQSASSVIEVNYYQGSNNFGPAKWGFSRFRGTAPVFELGENGTLIAALDNYIEELKERNGFARPWPQRASAIPLRAYRLEAVERIERMRGMAVLDPKDYPVFVWIPPSGNWQEARQLYFDEMAERATPSIRVVKITVEPAWGETVKKKIDNNAAWTQAVRDDETHQQSGIFKLRSWMFERGTLF